MQQTEVRTSPAYPLWLRSGYVVCGFIALAAVVRRLVVLTGSSGADPLGLDARFHAEVTLTVSHIVPAALFVILSGFILSRRRAVVLERAWAAFGLITGITAYAMSGHATGGWMERAAVLVFDTWFLFSLSRALLSQEGHERQEWRIRAVGTLLGIATTRPVIGFFFATRGMTQLAPEQFFGIAFWIGFAINTGLIEIWLQHRKRFAS